MKKKGTKFPTTRVKKIMQADEDVGKVATVVPVLVAKALELFTQSLIDAACEEARALESKKILPSTLKACILKHEQFDFLSDKVSDVADLDPSQASATKRGRKKSSADGEDGEKPEKKKRQKKVIAAADDDEEDDDASAGNQ